MIKISNNDNKFLYTKNKQNNCINFYYYFFNWYVIIYLFAEWSWLTESGAHVDHLVIHGSSWKKSEGCQYHHGTIIGMIIDPCPQYTSY